MPRVRIVAGLALLLFPAVVHAAARSRFEPTDLELEKTGVLDIDLQLGTFQGDPSRPAVADLELDLGVAPNVEIDVDAAMYGEGTALTRIARRHIDPLWTSMKLGLIDGRDPERRHVWGLGLQLGPRFALGNEGRGIGYEMLLLTERTFGGTILALNSGVLIDPPTPTLKHAAGIELGLDLTTKIVGSLSLIAELGLLRFFTEDPHQAYATTGVSYAVTPHLDVNAIALFGFAREGDRFGVLMGLSPKIAL